MYTGSMLVARNSLMLLAVCLCATPSWGLEPQSRLSCQARVKDSDLVIEIPKYTINMVKEGH